MLRRDILSRIISYVWSNFAHREKLNARKIRFFRARPFCDDRGISACRIFAFPPAAADCEMKFYIKLGVFSSFLFLSYSASSSLAARFFSFFPLLSLFLPRSSSPFMYLRTDRSLYRRLHIYWRCCLSRDDAWYICYRVYEKYVPMLQFVVKMV